MIIVDDRENKKVQNALRKYFPDLIVMRLDYGDVVDTEKSIVIERKKDLDLSSSIDDGRLPDQSKGMKDNFEHAYIIKIGTYENVRKNRYHQKMSVNRFIGGETDCLCYDGIPVCQVENDSQFARYCDSIFRKMGTRRPKKFIKKRRKNKNDQKLSVLFGVEGLGEKRCRALLKYFKTIGAICRATEEELMDVPGIGKKRAVQIKKVLN